MATCGWRNTAGHWPPIGNGGTLRDTQAATWDANCVNTLLEWKIPYASNCYIFWAAASRILPGSRVVLQGSRLRQGVVRHKVLFMAFCTKPFGNVWVCMGARGQPRKKARRAAKSGTPNGLKAAYHIARRTVLNPQNRVRSACFMRLGCQI